MVAAELASAIQSSPLGGLFKAAGVQPKGGSEGIVIEGPLAALLRRGAYWYRQPTDDQKLRVGRSWLQAATKEFQRNAPQGGSANVKSSGSAETSPPSPATPPASSDIDSAVHSRSDTSSKSTESAASGTSSV